MAATQQQVAAAPAAAPAPAGGFGAVDIVETPQAFIYKADAPGLTKRDVTVRIVDGSLELSGSRSTVVHDEGANYHRHERHVGRFTRRFKVPEDGDVDSITASCDHGILTVVLPKRAVAANPIDIRIDSGADEGDGSLNAAFERVPISIFPAPALGKIVTVRSDMLLLDAMHLLSAHQILAAPVLDVSKPATAAWTEKYMGVLSMHDIVFYMLETLKPSGKAPVDLATDIATIDAFKTLKVGDCASTVKFGPFIPVDVERGTLLDCMLLAGNHAIHRVMVVKSPGGDLVNVITQSALVQTLHANISRPEFQSVAKKTLRELGLGNLDLMHKVRATQPLREAFELIRDKGVSAVPVVDAYGQLKGNISARDVRLVATSPRVYQLLAMPISAYLGVVADQGAIACLPDDTMATVIERLVANRIHRIYVVDAANRPIRVVSLRDVIRKFTKEPKGFFGHFFN